MVPSIEAGREAGAPRCVWDTPAVLIHRPGGYSRGAPCALSAPFSLLSLSFPSPSFFTLFFVLVFQRSALLVLFRLWHDIAVRDFLQYVIYNIIFGPGRFRSLFPHFGFIGLSGKTRTYAR